MAAILMSASSRLDRWFGFTSRGSTLNREVLAGLTTFSTLSYVMIVNPMILAPSGMNFGALITVTAVVAAIFTFLMGLRTNYPLALAPAMGSNAYIAVQVCQGMHVPWAAAIGLCFYSGVLFFVISVTGLRQRIIESFPNSFKKIIGSGIGFFIAYLGLKNAGLIVANPASIIGLGKMSSPTAMLGFFGIIATLILVYRRVPGALILSILGLSVVGLFLPGTQSGQRITEWPQGLISWPNSMGRLAFKLDLSYFWLHPSQSLPIVLTLLFGDLFSAMAVLFAVGARAHLVDENGNLPKLREALSADATAAVGGALLGGTTPIIYLESAAGVEQGGRTGLVSVVVAFCFLAALFATPLIAVVPAVATTPALVMIGIFMVEGMADIDLRDLSVAATALITVLLMVLASASDGLAIGLIVNVALLAAVGKAATIKPFAYVLAGIFLIHYLI
jgi:AGZA family xanthine/uracil permease-like MFS transporter